MAEKQEKRSLRGLETGIIISLLLVTGIRAEIIEKKVKEGDEVTLVATYSGSPMEINWKVDGNKVVDMDLNPPDPIFFRYKDRATISPTNGSLTIRNLTTGDSGLYKGEALVNGFFQNTEYRLTVLECPGEPIISDQSTEEMIDLVCESSTKDVTYEWQDKEKVIRGQKYHQPRPKEDVTITCSVQNELCGNRNSIKIPYTPESSLDGVIAAVVVVVLLLLTILFVVLYKYNTRVKSCVDFCLCCIGYKGYRLIDSDDCDSLTLFLGCKELINCIKFWMDEMLWIKAELPDHKIIESRLLCIENVNLEEAEDYTAEAKTENSNSATEGTRQANESQNIQKMEMGVKNKVTPVNVIKEVVEYEDMQTMETGVKNKVTPLDEPKYGRVIFTVDNGNNGEDVTTTLKKCQETLCQWTLRDQELRSGNITLKSDSVTIKNLEENDSGTYKIDIYTTKGQVMHYVFDVNVTKQENQDTKKLQIKVEKAVTIENDTKQDDKSQHDQNTKQEEEEEALNPGNGLGKDEPIGNVTFHLNKTADQRKGAHYTWKKDEQPLTIDRRIKCGPDGDLTINNFTSADRGTYTVQYRGQNLKQTFVL